MAKKKEYDSIKDFTLYLIYHPHTKESFVSYCKTTSLENAFKTHYTLRNTLTKNLFKQFKESIYPPEMYVIHQESLTLNEITSLKIIWIKYFIEQGLNSINSPDDITAAFNLFDENTEIYNKIKDTNLQDIIINKNRRFATYGREKSSNKEDVKLKKVTLRVSEEELEIIKENAAQLKKSMNAYIKGLSLDPVIINYDETAIIENNKHLIEIKNELRPLIKTIIYTNQAFPTDIEKIINLLEEITVNQKIMHQNQKKDYEKIRKQRKKEIEELVKKEEKNDLKKSKNTKSKTLKKEKQKGEKK